MRMSAIKTTPINASIPSEGPPKATKPLKTHTLSEHELEVDSEAQEVLGFKNLVTGDGEAEDSEPRLIEEERPLADALKRCLWDEVLDENSVRNYMIKLLVPANLRANLVRVRMEYFGWKMQLEEDYRRFGFGYIVDDRLARTDDVKIMMSFALLLLGLCSSFYLSMLAYIIFPSMFANIWLSIGIIIACGISGGLSPLLSAYLFIRIGMGRTSAREVAKIDALNQAAIRSPYLGWATTGLESYDAGRIPTPVLEVRRTSEKGKVPERYLIAVWDEEDYRVLKEAL